MEIFPHVSVMPYDTKNLQPKTAKTFFWVAGAMGDPPQLMTLMELRSTREEAGDWAKIASMVLAMLAQVTPSRSIVSRTLEVSNLGHTTCLPPHMVTV